MATAYEDGVAGWAQCQLDERCSTLLAHLARWQRQEGNRCELWRQLIVLQRQRIARILARLPSLRAAIAEPEFLQDVWLDALIKVVGEDYCYDLPDTSPWTLEQALAPDFWPD